MELTPEEMEFLRQYRALSQYDKGRVDEEIDLLLREEEKKKWKLCEKGEKK